MTDEGKPPDLGEPSDIEKREDPGTERLRKTVFWSFFVSQGDPALQRLVLSNVVRLHPEVISSIEQWGKELHFLFKPDVAVKHDDLKRLRAAETAFGVESPECQKLRREFMWTVDTDKFDKNTSAQLLMEDVKKFVKGRIHPKGTTSEPDSPEFHFNIRTETKLRVVDLLATILPARIENKPEAFDSIEDFSLKLIEKDFQLMQSYAYFKSEEAKESDEKRAHRILARESIGVSLICKYGLSAKRNEAVPRLSSDVQDVLENAGNYIRANKEKFLAPVEGNKRGVLRPRKTLTLSKLTELLAHWKQETGEDIVL